MASRPRHRAKKLALTRAAEWWAQGCPGGDIKLEQHLAHLRDEGWNDTALDIERAEIEELRRDGCIERAHWKYIVVFCSCAWTHRPVGMGASVPSGIASAEIIAACMGCGIPRKEWADVFSGVRLMVSAALPHLVQKQSQPSD